MTDRSEVEARFWEQVHPSAVSDARLNAVARYIIFDTNPFELSDDELDHANLRTYMQEIYDLSDEEYASVFSVAERRIEKELFEIEQP
jgi:hypothetical protein